MPLVKRYWEGSVAVMRGRVDLGKRAVWAVGGGRVAWVMTWMLGARGVDVDVGRG